VSSTANGRELTRRKTLTADERRFTQISFWASADGHLEKPRRKGQHLLISPTRFQTLEDICVNLRLMSLIRVHSRVSGSRRLLSAGWFLGFLRPRVLERDRPVENEVFRRTIFV
jgi:hypothetical protein